MEWSNIFTIILTMTGLFLGFIYFLMGGLNKRIDDLKDTLKESLKPLDIIKSQIDIIKSQIQHIREALIAKGILDPYSFDALLRSNSPKRITEKGHEFLNKHNIKEFLKSCDLLENIDRFKEKEEIEIYKECLEWSKNHTIAINKAFELSYNSNLSQKQSTELIAFVIRDEILDKIKHD